MAYKIGTVTLIGSWDISGSGTISPGEKFGPNSFQLSPEAVKVGSAGASCQFGLGNLSVEGTIAMVGGHIAYPGNPANSEEGYLTPPEAHIMVRANSQSETYINNVASQDYSGSAVISIPCDICFEVTGGPPEFPGDIVDSPPFSWHKFSLIGNGDATCTISFCGYSISDTYDVRGQEVTANAAAQVNASASGGGVWHLVSASPLTETFFESSGSSDISATYTGNLSADDIPVKSKDTSTTLTFPGYVSSGSASVSYSAHSSAGAGDVSASVNNGVSAQAASSFYCTKKFSLDGVLRAMKVPFPDTLTVHCSRYGGDPDPFVSAAGGAFSVTGTQVNYTLSVYADDPDHSVNDGATLNTFQAISASLDADGLAATGDDPKAGRILLHGQHVAGLSSIHQDASYTLDDMYAGVWGGTGGAVAVRLGNVLTIATGSSTGGAYRTYDPELGASSYRYLRIRLQSVGASHIPLTVRIPPCRDDLDPAQYYPGTPLGSGGSGTPEKKWLIRSGEDGVWQDVDIDLCAPYDPPLTEPDLQDTRWPLPSTMSVTSGVWRIGTLAFENIPADSQIEISTISLERHAPTSTLTWLPTLYPSVYTRPFTYVEPSVEPPWPTKAGPDRLIADNDDEPTVSEDYIRRFLLGNTDGRQTVEETDFIYTKTVGGMSGKVTFDWRHQTIKKLADALMAEDTQTLNDGFGPGTGGVMRWPGWTAITAVPDPTDTTPFVPAYTNQPKPAHDYYFNDSMRAVTLFGGGALYSPPSGDDDPGGWSYGFDQIPINVDGQISVFAQELYDVVEWTGMEGDGFGFLGTGAGSGAGAGQPLILKAAAILRSQFHGLVLDEDGNPAADITVRATDITDSLNPIDAGDGVTSDRGYYQTGSPYARANEVPPVPPALSGPSRVDRVRVAAGPEPRPEGILTPYTRHRHRATFMAPPIPCSDTLFLGGAVFDPFTDPAPERLSRLLPYASWRILAATETAAGKDQAGE